MSSVWNGITSKSTEETIRKIMEKHMPCAALELCRRGKHDEACPAKHWTQAMDAMWEFGLLAGVSLCRHNRPQSRQD